MIDSVLKKLDWRDGGGKGSGGERRCQPACPKAPRYETLGQVLTHNPRWPKFQVTPGMVPPACHGKANPQCLSKLTLQVNNSSNIYLSIWGETNDANSRYVAKVGTRALGLQRYTNWTLGDPCLLCQWVLSPVNLLVPLGEGSQDPLPGCPGVA